MLRQETWRERGEGEFPAFVRDMDGSDSAREDGRGHRGGLKLWKAGTRGWSGLVWETGAVPTICGVWSFAVPDTEKAVERGTI